MVIISRWDVKLTVTVDPYVLINYTYKGSIRNA